MSRSPIRIFISYAREDETFARRLQGSLESRGIEPWVDRRRLEGGDQFDIAIERAITRSDCLVVILSPNAVQSSWVRKEILFAMQLEKVIIPLMLYPTQIPVTLANVNFISFMIDYDAGLRELLIAVYHRVDNNRGATRLGADTRDTHSYGATVAAPYDDSSPIVLVPPPDPAPAPDPDLNALYQAGVEAESAGDLERAAVLWQEVLDRGGPDFRKGQVVEDMERLRPQLHVSRVQKLTKLAEAAVQDEHWLEAAIALQELVQLEPDERSYQERLLDALRHHALAAHRLGQWTEAMGSWRGMRMRLPRDPDVVAYLEDAEHNSGLEPLYEDARRFLGEGKPEPARRQLKILYEKAPTYGDPGGVAAALGMTVGPTLIEREEAEDRRREEVEVERIATLKRLERERVDVEKQIEAARKTEATVREEIASTRSRQMQIERTLRELESTWEMETSAYLRIAKSASTWSAMLNASVFLFIGLAVTLLVVSILALIEFVAYHRSVVNTSTVVTATIGVGCSILACVIVAWVETSRVNDYQHKHQALQKSLEEGNFDAKLSDLEKNRVTVREHLRDLNGRKKHIDRTIKERTRPGKQAAQAGRIRRLLQSMLRK